MAKLVATQGVLGSVTIPLEETGTDEYGWLAQHNYKVPSPAGDGSTVSLEVTKPITFRESSETTRKGVVRIMRRVELPYTALYPSDTVTGDSNLKVSPTRSKGLMSVHIVITLPKECVDDIKAQVAGQAGLHLAEMQVRQIAALGEGLGALTPPGLTGPDAHDARSEYGEVLSDGTGMEIVAIGDDAPSQALIESLTRYLNGYKTASETTLVSVGGN